MRMQANRSLPAPFFTVVVPVHDGANYLEEALASITAQSFPGWECCIIDDGSSDASADIARSWIQDQSQRAVLIHHEGGARRRVAASRNAGVAAARAPWIAFLDQDDVWMPDKLALQAEFISERPRLDAVGCWPELFFDGVPAMPFLEDWARMIYRLDADRAAALGLGDFVAGCLFCMSGVVARKAALQEQGGFEPALRGTSDWLMWACMAARRPLGMLPVPLVTYRIHGANELLKLHAPTMGLPRALVELHTHLARRLARDRDMTEAEAVALVKTLFLETGEAWLRSFNEPASPIQPT
ncbi:MAG: glycosyltransferase family A protein [Rhodothermales bacterium]